MNNNIYINKPGSNKRLLLRIIFNFLFSILLLSCSDVTHEVSKNKPETSLCKAPFCSFVLKASLFADNIKQTGTDAGKMVLIKCGTFEMGTNNFPDVRPVHKVTVSSFYMDIHQVTNDQFTKFVKATGYITIAEHSPNSKDYPNGGHVWQTLNGVIRKG